MWKLRVGAEDYYLNQVAKGLDDYYSGAGETRGEWTGAASAALGLVDEVTGDELRAVLAGLAPGTGLCPNGDQVRTWKGRVPGFDLTFSAPKSVSVLYAFADPLVRSQVTEATDTAITEALAWLEREACFVRRGSNNRRSKTAAFEQWGTRRLPGKGFIAAQFRHRTSRAGDPQLHCHVLIANLTQGPDAKWSALDGQALYRSKIAAGAVYQSVLRNELSRRLGVEWNPVHDNLADIAGIPRRVLQQFSKRRSEIEAELARTGQCGLLGANAAALATRKVKADIDHDTLDAQWIAEAASINYGPNNINELLATATAHATPPGPLTARSRIAVRAVDRDTGEVYEEHVTIDAFAARIGRTLPETDAVVSRHDVQNAVAAQLCHTGSIEFLERLCDAVLAHRELIPLPIADHADAGWEQQWTTRTLLNTEVALHDMFTPNPTAPPVGALDAVFVEHVLATLGRTLGADQADTVRRLATQGLAVEAVVGKAGTGKTYTMNTVRELYQAAGYHIYGACPTGRAARELCDGAGIDAMTIHKFLNTEIEPNSIIVMDESGMVGTFMFHAVVDRARHVGAKVIVVGDHHQLPEIEAGGGFHALLNAVGDQKCELTVNRRQRHEWEHPALDHLRNGDISAFWQAYLDHDRVVLEEHQTDVQRRAVNDWFGAYQAGSNAHMLAGTRSEANLLNDLARDLAAAAGRLSGDVLEVQGCEFQVGDRILLTKNMGGQHDLDTARNTSVDNGMIATITHIEHDTGDMNIQLVNGRRLALSAKYVHQGNITHGYATTFHKAQGLTCDDVFVVGPNGMYRESGYVALSRARNQAHLYATSKDAAAIGERTHSTGIALPSENTGDAEADILATLNVSKAKQFALTHQPHLIDIADVAGALTCGQLDDRLHHVNTVTAQLRKAGHVDPSASIERLRLATAHRSVMHIGARVKALDWDNVGTITEMVDTVGHARVRFVSADRTREFHKLLAWEHIRPIDNPEPAELTEYAQQFLHELADQIVVDEQIWNEELADAGIHPAEPVVVPAAIDHRRRQLLHQLRATPPQWLTWWTGPRPTDATGAVVYDDHLRELAVWRDTHHLASDVAGFGPRPDDPDVLEAWRTHLDNALEIRNWLTQHRPQLDDQRLVPIGLSDARQRLVELDALFATAPADQRRIIDDLTNNTELTVEERVEALTVATQGQQQRADWILQHWPHVIEHLELLELTADAGPLDHWPTPLPSGAQELFNDIAATSADATEERTLNVLDEILDAQNPAHRLHRYRQQRATIRATIDALQDSDDPHIAAAAAPQLDRLRERETELSEQIRDAENHQRFHNWGSAATRDLDDAINQRTTHLAHTAITTHQCWVGELVRTAHHTNPDLSTQELRRLIDDVAAYRERADIDGTDPLGAPLPHAHRLADTYAELNSHLVAPDTTRITVAGVNMDLR